METTLLYVLTVLGAVIAALCIVILVKVGRQRDIQSELDKLRRENAEQSRALRTEISESTRATVRAFGEVITDNQRHTDRALMDKLSSMEQNLMQKQELSHKAVIATQTHLEERLKTSAIESEQKLENIRVTVEKRLGAMQQDNNKKLDEMRAVVDEKLQKTLEERMTQSFKLVSDRLEQVYKGLGEMQSLAVGVGDLKKVLSSVKTRGILGEIQLGAILEEILTPEQYDTNVVTVKGSGKPVEYAIKLPGDGDSHVYLPIDSKFPMDAYAELCDSYESGAPERVKLASDVLKNRIKSFAKDIREKYVSPPATTEFAIMFLPTEGLYAEVVKLGMVETLQRDYRVNVAGPSTMAALLNSLQMGFRSVAIQKRSGEVWNVLSAVKTEFDKFEKVLASAQDKLSRASNDLDTLVGVRSRQIRSKLRGVTAMPQAQVKDFLPEAQNDYDDEPAEPGDTDDNT